jgi:hypothetical protein
MVLLTESGSRLTTENGFGLLIEPVFEPGPPQIIGELLGSPPRIKPRSARRIVRHAGFRG